MHFTCAAPGDYTTTIKVLQFSANKVSFTFSVLLKIDSVYEATETFFGNLQLQSTPLNVLVNPSRANLVINDNNRKHASRNNQCCNTNILSLSLA